MKQLYYFPLVLTLIVFMAACSGSGDSKTPKFTGKLKVSGTEILQDAKDYADMQCKFKQREHDLKNDSEVKDFDLKMQQLKMDRKKAKNFYQKKYDGMPEERVAFQRAVSSARRDSEFCNNKSKNKPK
jgi:hypothetical protein